jgi:hypothetical protein
VRRAYDKSAFVPAPPQSNGRRIAVRPVPLDRLLGNWNITYDEVPGLTVAAAGAHLLRWGLHQPQLLNDASPLSGFIFARSDGGVCANAYVLVEQKDPVPRRRFTAAHELGHFLLHFPPAAEGDGPATLLIPDGPTVVRETVDDAPPDEGFAAPAPAEVPSLPWREREANRFAAELLMPEAVVRALHEHYTTRFGDAPRFVEGHIAGDLLVSRQAVRYRLADLGLGDGGVGT